MKRDVRFRIEVVYLVSRISPPASRAGTLEFTTHSLAPEGVLGLAQDVFRAPTKGYALAVRGYDFHDVGDQISKDAAKNLEAALSFLVGALQPGGSLHPMEVDA